MRMNATQFFEMLYYLHNVKVIFTQLDAHRSGGIDACELLKGFQLSGVNMDPAVVEQIVVSYDADVSKTLEFDEFLQFRLEWDCYISAWDLCTLGHPAIEPQQLWSVLEEVKRTTEPIITSLSAMGLSLRYIFHAHREFRPATCEALIVRFGSSSSCCLPFEQFCAMMVSLREMKAAFCGADPGGSGALSAEALAKAMMRLGMNMPAALVAELWTTYAAHLEEGVEFDEFVQIMVEWNEVWREQQRFGATGRIGALQLREILGSVRVIYRIVNGAVEAARPFHVHTCRWLLATFGARQAGEAFAQSLSWAEFLNLVWFVKGAHRKFNEFNVTQMGVLSADELGLAMAAYGIRLSSEAIDNIVRSFDVDGSGTFEFDEFLQIVLECQMADQSFELRAVQPVPPSPLLAAAATPRTPPASPHTSPLLGALPAPGFIGLQGVVSAGDAAAGWLSCGRCVTLDKSEFFSLIFAVPRHVGRERRGAS